MLPIFLLDFIVKFNSVVYTANLTVGLICWVILKWCVKTEPTSKSYRWPSYLGNAYFFIFLQYLLLLLFGVAKIHTVYPVTMLGIPEFLASNPDIYRVAPNVIMELFGICINLFLFATATSLIKDRKLGEIPFFSFVKGSLKEISFKQLFYKLFVTLVLIDLATMVIAPYEAIYTPDSTILTLTSDFIGNLMSALTIFYLAYTSFINSRFYLKGKVWIIGLLLAYALLQLVPSFIPILAEPIGIKYQINQKIAEDLLLSMVRFFSFPLKAILFFFAFRIITLEMKTLIRIRQKLRETTALRKVFFSSDQILKAIYHVFEAQEIRLYVRVPVCDSNNEIHDKAHLFVYHPDHPTSRYRIVKLEDTPISRILGNKADEFEGVAAISYHGGVIGCLQIVKDVQQNLYSTERLMDILSVELSPFLQFYRLQESLLLLTRMLKLEVQNDDGSVKSFESMRVEMQTNIRRNLFPESLHLNMDPRFLSEVRARLKDEPVLSNGEIEPGPRRNLSARITAFFRTIRGGTVDNRNDVSGPYPAVESMEKVYDLEIAREDEGFPLAAEDGGHLSANVGGEAPENENSLFSMGSLSLEFKAKRDSLDRPSMGYYESYGKTVAAIAANSYMDAIGKVLEIVIERLGLELTQKQTYDTWIETITKYAAQAEIDEILFLHPRTKTYWQVPDGSGEGEFVLKSILEEKFGNSRDIAELIEAENVPLVLQRSPDLIVGLKLTLHGRRGDKSFMIVRISEDKVPSTGGIHDIKFNKKWELFLSNLAGIAGTSLTRIIQAYQIAERQKEASIVETATKIGLLTHQIVNNCVDLEICINDLEDYIAGLSVDEEERLKLSETINELRKIYLILKKLASGIRFAPNENDEETSCSLSTAVQNAVVCCQNTYDDKVGGVKIINNVGMDSGQGTKAEIEINIPSTIVELIFTNLINNSLRAIGNEENLAEPKIEIWTEGPVDGDEIVCFISDNGCGIAFSDRQLIFEPDFTTKAGGVGGMGLFLVEKTLNLHRSRIEVVDYPGPAQTVFRLTLPTLNRR